MPSSEVFRAVQHAAGVHRAPMGTRSGYSSVVSLQLPNRIIERPTISCAPVVLGFLQSLFHVLIIFALAHGLLDIRSR